MSPRPRLPDDQLSPNARGQRKYRENPENRLKGAIRNRIHAALKKGRLVKTRCICGSLQVEAHHYAGYDLAHALDVVWLCKRHHEALHHEFKPRKAIA
jgi:hypothetical protein